MSTNLMKGHASQKVKQFVMPDDKAHDIPADLMDAFELIFKSVSNFVLSCYHFGMLYSNSIRLRTN